jgi:ribosomal protein L30E
MAKKKELSEDLKLLRDRVKEGKAIVGTERVVKALKTGNLSKVFLVSNTSEDTKETIEHYANLANVSVMVLGLDNEELGVLCKKNFFISVVGIIEE